jgi:hypothetical protein
LVVFAITGSRGILLRDLKAFDTDQCGQKRIKQANPI